MKNDTKEVQNNLLTEEETKLVNTKKKEEGTRPSYYNRLTDTEYEISKEFETFLILLSTSTKEQMLTYIKKTTTATATDNLRDELLGRVLVKEYNYVESAISALKEMVDDYNKFRVDLRNVKKSTAPEVGLLLESLSKGIETLLHYYDRYNHYIKLMDVVAKQQTTIVDPNELKEKLSWVKSLIEYM